PQQRRLARAVRAEDADEAVRRHREADASQHRRALVIAEPQIGRGQHGIKSSATHSPRLTRSPGRTRIGSENAGASTTAVWYSPRSPHGSIPRSAKAAFISAPSARPSQVSSSHGSRIVTIKAVAFDATNSSNRSPVGRPNNGST